MNDKQKSVALFAELIQSPILDIVSHILLSSWISNNLVKPLVTIAEILSFIYTEQERKDTNEFLLGVFEVLDIFLIKDFRLTDIVEKHFDSAELTEEDKGKKWAAETLITHVTTDDFKIPENVYNDPNSYINGYYSYRKMRQINVGEITLDHMIAFYERFHDRSYSSISGPEYNLCYNYDKGIRHYFNAFFSLDRNLKAADEHCAQYGRSWYGAMTHINMSSIARNMMYRKGCYWAERALIVAIDLEV